MKTFYVLFKLLLICLIVSGKSVRNYDDDEDDDDETTEDEEIEQEQNDQDKVKVTKRPAIESLTEWVPSTIIYHNETQKYYEILSQGPCTSNLKFLPASERLDEKYGECNCHQFETRGSESYVPLVYHYPSEKCYHLYRRGYCRKTNQWLVFTRKDRVECSDNPCLKSGLDPDKVVWFDRKCVELGDPCYLDDGTRLVVAFNDFDVVPTCTKLKTVDANVTAVGVNETNNMVHVGCPIGKRPISNGGCLTVDVVG